MIVLNRRSVPAIDISELGVADADRILQHCREHRLKNAAGAIDGLKNLRRGCLLFCASVRSVLRSVRADLGSS